MLAWGSEPYQGGERMMKLSILITGYPMLLLDTMKEELAKYTACEVVQLGLDVSITCTADVVKCMEVIAIADKYNFRMDDDDYQLFTLLKTP